MSSFNLVIITINQRILIVNNNFNYFFESDIVQLLIKIHSDNF